MSSRKVLRISGRVERESERAKLLQIAEHHVGDGYDIVDEIVVNQGEKTEA